MKSNLIGKKLLVMGGMQISCEIIKKAQEMGIWVGVADYFPKEKSPGKVIANQHYEISIIDVDAVVALIQREKYDGVLVGFNDMLLPYYAEICRKAKLPCYGTKEQFDILIDKKQYKKLCRQFNVPCIEEYSIDDDKIQYPVLVKPIDSSGSRGITICHNKSELDKAILLAKDLSKKREFLIERYMDGQEVTVFWLFQDGKYYLSGLANRHVKHNQGVDIIPLPVGYTFPSIYLPKYRLEIEDNCKKMFQYLGIKDGMLFMQCKVEDGVCYVYDIGYRLTGSLEYKIIKEVSSCDPLEMMINFALTGKMSDKDLSKYIRPEYSKPAFNVSCLCAPGTIKKIIGIDEVMCMKNVIDVVVSHYPGETITDSMKGLLAQITLRVLGTTDSKDDILRVMQKINNTIKIICEDDKNHLLAGIEQNDIDGLVL